MGYSDHPVPRKKQVNFVRTVLLVMVLFCTGGCYRIPSIQPPLMLPANFSRGGTLPLPARWWTSLGNPPLNALMEQALQANFDVRAAWARLRQSLALVRKSKADWYPNLRYNADGSAGVNEMGFLGSTQFGLAASYEIDLWGRIRSETSAVTLEAMSTQETLKTTAISLSAEVATTWYQWAERLGQIELLARQTETNQKTLSLINARFRLGQASAADVLQQQQLLEALAGEKEQVLAQVEQLRNQMAVLLGRSSQMLVSPPTSSWRDVPALPQTGIPATLVQRRPDVRSAFLRIKAAHHRVASAVADQFPRLTLSANATGSARTFGNFVGNWVASLAAGLFGPIFDGGLRRAEVVRQKAIAEEALQLYGKAIVKALQEVEDALAREKHQHRLLASQRKQIKLAAWVVEQTQYNYLNGTENFLRVLDAMRSHQALERTYLSSQRDLVLIRISLCRSLAGGWAMQEKPKTGQSHPSPTHKRKVQP